MLMYLDHLQNWLVLGHGLLIFVILALFLLSEMGQIWGFRAFPGKRMAGMAWDRVCCCILTTFRTDKIMVTVCWFFSFWCYFDLVKQVKFGVSRHFLENPLRKWPEILHADVSWPLCELIRLWLQFVHISNFDLVKRVKFGVSRHFGRALWIFLIMVTLWLKLVIFGVAGHYLEKSMGINVEGRAEAYFRRFASSAV